MIRKVGVVGDVHCEDARLAATLRFFEKQKVEEPPVPKGEDVTRRIVLPRRKKETDG